LALRREEGRPRLRQDQAQVRPEVRAPTPLSPRVHPAPVGRVGGEGLRPNRYANRRIAQPERGRKPAQGSRAQARSVRFASPLPIGPPVSTPTSHAKPPQTHRRAIAKPSQSNRKATGPRLPSLKASLHSRLPLRASVPTPCLCGFSIPHPHARPPQSAQNTKSQQNNEVDKNPHFIPIYM
jgi:hypothetical protein